MSGNDPFDDALDATIDAMHRGRPIDAALSDLRRQNPGMRPLLETAGALRGAPGAPLSRRLAHNYAIVQAAVERAQIAARSQPRPVAPTPAPWWRRRLTFASISIPAGAAALVLTAGAAAAATASVATTDMGSRVADVLLPEQVASHVPGIGERSSQDSTGAPPADRGNENSNVSPGDLTPGDDNGPTQVTVSGAISDINGGTFTLTNVDGAWLVQMDGETAITGNVWEEAAATVIGVATAERNLHAESVVSSGGIEPVDSRPPNEAPDNVLPESREGDDSATPSDGEVVDPPLDTSNDDVPDRKTPPANGARPATPPAQGPPDDANQGNANEQGD